MFKPMLLTVVAVVALQPSSEAAIMVSQGVSAPLTIVTIDPITFTRTANGDAGFLVFEDYWANTSTVSGTGVNPHTMTYSINGAPAVNPTQFSASGRYIGSFEGFDDNDLAFDFNGVGQIPDGTIGDTIVIGGTFSFNHNGQSDITATTGPWLVHLSGSSGTIASVTLGGSAAAVPEPSTFAFIGLGGIGMGVTSYRRKKKQMA